jgi:hypothetical protein
VCGPDRDGAWVRAGLTVSGDRLYSSGCSAPMLHNPVAQADRDRGARAGLATYERKRAKALGREIRVLRQARGILCKASAHPASRSRRIGRSSTAGGCLCRAACPQASRRRVSLRMAPGHRSPDAGQSQARLSVRGHTSALSSADARARSRPERAPCRGRTLRCSV